MDSRETKKVGRKPKYEEDDILSRIGAISAWRRRGLNEEQIAAKLDIAVSTFNLYKNRYPELVEALKTGRDEADMQVETSLYQQAMAGNIAAIIFYLKNRKATDWRDKQEIQHSGEILTKDKIEERQKSGFLKFLGVK